MLQRRRVAGLVMLGVLVAACGEADDSGRGTPSAADPPQTSAAVVTTTPTPTPDTSLNADPTISSDDPPQGGRLRLAMMGDPSTWDGTAYFSYAWAIGAVTCNRLVDYPTVADPGVPRSLRADLAAELPRISANGRRYTFQLRPGLRFSDGRPVRPQDVKGTFLRLLDPAAAFDGANTAYYDSIRGVTAYKAGEASGISGITTTADGSVSFELVAADGSFLYALALPFACVVPADAPHRKANLPPPMTGPYQVVAHQHNRSARLERNPVWEQNVAAGIPEDPGTNNVDGFDVEIGVSPEQQLLRLRNGSLDLSLDQSALVGAAVGDVASDESLEDRFHVHPALVNGYVFLNTSLPPFDDVRVRQAVNYAVDRVAILRLLGGEHFGQPSSNLLPSAMMTSPADALPYPAEPDVERARELMQSAGAEGSEFTLLCQTGGPDVDIAAQIKSDLAAIGLNVKVRCLATDAYFGFIVDPANRVQAGFGAWEADYPDASTVLMPLLHSTAADDGYNLARFTDSAFDAALAQAHRLPPGTERRRAWTELATRTMREQAPWLPLFEGNAMALTSERYGGYFYAPEKGIHLGLAYIKEQ